MATEHAPHLFLLLTFLVFSSVLACSTPVPTPTSIPTATPVPTPTLADLFDVPADRAISVGAMQGMGRRKDGEFWRDGDPILLRGCATGVYDNFVGRRWAVFSQDGDFSEDRFFVQVGGYRKVSKGSCYDMVVSKFRDRSRCYSTSFLPPSPYGCGAGWEQRTELFLVAETGPGPAIRPISRSAVGGQQ